MGEGLGINWPGHDLALIVFAAGLRDDILPDPCRSGSPRNKTQARMIILMTSGGNGEIDNADGWLWLSAAVLLGGYLGGLRIFGNFHTVVAGELYRSANVDSFQ